MKMKYRILIILSVLIMFTTYYGLAYSFFNSDSTLDPSDKNIAKFIFNSESLDQFQLSLIDLYPGDTKEYEFSVSNSNLEIRSDVSVEYQMTFKTYHFIPLIIELYKLNGESEELILTCDETFSRSDQNELICDAPIQDMAYSSEGLDNYKVKVKFPNEYNDETYSDLVDYLNIELKSWQKIND